ncbi:iron chaperone [Glaciibacter sp. 2TAF33]|uniref:iron chaperone n=1 Tax=Glaciibacter sp. 2TAF33 TaxID=3233015 RepID=UPI003F93CE3B
MNRTPASVDEYIATFPEDVQAVLQEVRRTVSGAAPGAAESISYGMPTVSIGQARIHFAGWKRHVAIYAIPTMEGELEGDLARYRGDKGTLTFPLAEPVPYPVIERAVAATWEQRS